MRYTTLGMPACGDGKVRADTTWLDKFSTAGLTLS